MGCNIGRQGSSNLRWAGCRGGGGSGPVAAGGSGFIEAGEEGVLALAPLDFLDAFGGVFLEVGALVPDAGEGVVAAFANGPDDEGDGFVFAFDVDGGVVEAFAGDEEERAEVGVFFSTDADGVSEGAATEHWEVGVGGFRAFSPVAEDVVSGIEGEIVGSVRRDVCGEAFLAFGLAFHEIPQGNEARGFSDGGDFVCSGEREGRQDGKEDEAHDDLVGSWSFREMETRWNSDYVFRGVRITSGFDVLRASRSLRSVSTPRLRFEMFPVGLLSPDCVPAGPWRVTFWPFAESSHSRLPSSLSF